ncbi:WYL domain-containing protein, partial [Acinetobacter baumannii]|nr:WYL domain-containing protein [Acinetobacter baumannii]
DCKTLYSDFDELERFGIDIITERQGRSTYYHMGARQFDLAELKILVDSVEAAKFITDARTKSLIKKLGRLTSRFDADTLK